jgi:hypothetical protein
LRYRLAASYTTEACKAPQDGRPVKPRVLNAHVSTGDTPIRSAIGRYDHYASAAPALRVTVKTGPRTGERLAANASRPARKRGNQMTRPNTGPALPRPEHRRWRVALALLIVLIAGLVGAWWYIVWAEERDFRAALVETDALDPGWRFADLQANRAAIPPDQNAAIAVSNACRALGGARGNMFKLEERIGEPPQNELLSVEDAAALRRFMDEHRAARIVAHQLKHQPGGRYAIKYAFDDAGASNETIMQPLIIAPFLRFDALLSAHDDDGAAAADILRASINNARSMGDEPNMMGFFVYVACMERTHGVLMRVLGQTVLPAAELRTLQAMLEHAMDEPRCSGAVRGERAFFVEMDAAIRERRIDIPAATLPRRGWRGWLPDWWPATAPVDRAGALRVRNELVEASRLPVEQQLDAVRRVIDARGTEDPTLAQTFGVWVGENVRCHAELRCAALGLATERYRIAEGSWPASADALVRAGYINAVPLDPYDGRPMRYRQLVDGVMFYSIGPDRVDNGGALGRVVSTSPGTDVGFRLWDPEARRQPLAAAPLR